MVRLTWAVQYLDSRVGLLKRYLYLFDLDYHVSLKKPHGHCKSKKVSRDGEDASIFMTAGLLREVSKSIFC